MEPLWVQGPIEGGKVFSLKEAETRAILLALKKAKSRGFSKVKFFFGCA